MDSELARRALKALLPATCHDTVRLIGYRTAHYGTRRYCLCCNSRLRRFLPYGAPPRPEAQCPVCGSLERHRMFSLFLRRHGARLAEPGPLLHVAPEPAVARLLRDIPGVHYMSTDLEQPDVTLRADISSLPVASGTLGALYCSHVLEHVEDDRRAMREFRRVLKPGGWALLQVPIRRGPTIEDPTVSDPALRQAMFGQPDHVRCYGHDFPNRLRRTGFGVSAMKPAAVLPVDAARRYGLNRREDLFFCSKAP